MVDDRDNPRAVDVGLCEDYKRVWGVRVRIQENWAFVWGPDVKDARIEAGYKTQERFAVACGWGQGLQTRIETGTPKKIKLWRWARMRNVLKEREN